MYHVFKKTFSVIWHGALWANMSKYNIKANPVRITGLLNNKGPEQSSPLTVQAKVTHKSPTQTRLSTLTHSVQYLPREDTNLFIGRTCWNTQQPTFADRSWRKNKNSPSWWSVLINHLLHMERRRVTRNPSWWTTTQMASRQKSKQMA